MLLLLVVWLVLLKQQGSPFQKFGFPTRKQLWIELMISAHICRTLASAQYIKNYLRLKLAVNRRRWVILPLFLGRSIPLVFTSTGVRSCGPLQSKTQPGPHFLSSVVKLAWGYITGQASTLS